MAPEKYTLHASQRMLELEGAQLAPFARRALAFFFDILLVAVVVSALVIAAMKGAEHLGWLPSDINLKLEFNFSNWYSLVSFVLYFGLFTYFGNGQTLGKRIARIRVVSTLHEHLTLWHSLERALGYGASALELGFGFLQYFIADNRQTTHDRIAGTIVIALPRKNQ